MDRYSREMICHSLDELGSILEAVHGGLHIPLLDIGARTSGGESDASHPVRALLLLVISSRNMGWVQGHYIPAR